MTAPVNTGSAAKAFGASPLTVVSPSATAGNKLVCTVVFADAGTGAAETLTAPGGWTADRAPASSFNSGSNAAAGLAVFSKTAAGGVENCVVAFPGIAANTFSVGIITEWASTGLGSHDTADASCIVTNNAAAGSTGATIANSGTLANADSIVFCVVSIFAGGISNAGVAAAGFTTIYSEQDSSTDEATVIGYKAVAGTSPVGGAYTWTADGSMVCAQAILAIYADLGGVAAPTLTDVDTDEAVDEGQTGVAVTGTAMDAAGGRTFALVQGSVVVTQTETGTPTDTTAALTIVTESTTSLKFGTASLRVTRTADSQTGTLSVTVNPPTGLIFVDVGTPDTTSAERITAVADIVSGDQIEARAVGGGAAPTGLTLNADATFYYTSGNTPTAFDVRVWDQSDSTWGAWATQGILAQPLINTQPVSQTAAVGGTETFTISAVASLGGGTLSYQWKVNGSNVGTNAASYTTATLSSGDNGGVVTCVVTDSNGSTTSLPVFIWISGIKTGYGPRIRSAWLRRSATRGAADSRAKGFALLRKPLGSVNPALAKRNVFLDFMGFTAPSAVGAMVGTTGVAFSETAVIKGVTHLVASAALTFSDSAVVRGSAHLVGTATLTFSPAATMRGVTHLAGSIAATFSESGTLTARGALSGSAALSFADSAAIKGLGALAGTTSIVFTSAATRSSSMIGSTSIAFTPAATMKGLGAMAGATALAFADSATIRGLAPAAGSAALNFASAATAKGLGAMSGTSSITFASTASRSGAMVGAAALSFAAAATIKGLSHLQGSAAVLFAQTAAVKGLGKMAASSSLVFAQTAVARGLGLISASSALTFSDSAVLKGVTHLSGTATLVFDLAAAFNGSSAMRGSTSIAFASSATIHATGALRASTSISFSPIAHARGLGAMSATSSIAFTDSGNLRLIAHISGTTAIAFDTLATLAGRGKIRGTAALVFASTAHATGVGRMAGSSGIVFAGTAREGSTQFISGSAQLTLDSTGQLVGRSHLRGVSSLTFTGSAQLRGTARRSAAAHLQFDCHAQLVGAVFITPARRHVIGHTENRSQIVHAEGSREGRVHTGRRRSDRERP